MKTLFFSLCLIGLFCVSCGSRDDDFNDDGSVDECLNFGDSQLNLTIQESFTTLPAKVSVFFRVNGTDGTAVPGLQSSNFRIFERGRNDDCFNQISNAESSAAIAPNSQIFRNNTFLVLDLSNSVLQGSLEQLQQASISFINNVFPSQNDGSFSMGIYWFDGEDILHLLHPQTTDTDDLITAINSITTDISNDPSTDLFGAIIKSTTLAEETISSFENDGIFAAASVVIFTDGTDQAARFTEEEALQSVNNANENISFFTIGLGSEIDTENLGDIGVSGSVFASNSSELEMVFNEISDNVAGQANSFYFFEYCSPKRDGSGLNELVIQAFDDNRQGAIQTSFDATGFTSGCQ